jgi:hypothetical protein
LSSEGDGCTVRAKRFDVGGDGLMKFMIEFSTRSGSTYEESKRNLEQLLIAFSKWEQPTGLTIHAFVVKVEALSGYVLIEADDPTILARFAAQFMVWNDAKYIPVIDVEQGVAAYNAGLDWVTAST